MKNKIKSIELIRWSLPLLIGIFLVVLTKTTLFESNPKNLSLGILFDLILTIPLVYLGLIWKSKIPKFTTVYVVIIGFMLASFIIPLEHQDLLARIKQFAIPILEVGVLFMLGFKFHSLRVVYKEKNVKDFYDKILMACQEVFPGRLGKLLATEIAVFYYLFAKVKKQNNGEKTFTYFRKSGIRTTVVVVLFILVVEAVVLHVLISKWNPAFAWVLTILSVYAILQITSILRSMGSRLIEINNKENCLNLRYGFGSQTDIPFSSIKSIEKDRRSKAHLKSNVCLSTFDMLDTTNVVIYLKEENTLHKIYGIEKKYTSISFYVDEVDMFVTEMKALI